MQDEEQTNMTKLVHFISLRRYDGAGIDNLTALTFLLLPNLDK
jgi:hypothetical protein